MINLITNWFPLYNFDLTSFLISGFLALKFLSNTADRLRILSKSPKIWCSICKIPAKFQQSWQRAKTRKTDEHHLWSTASFLWTREEMVQRYSRYSVKLAGIILTQESLPWVILLPGPKKVLHENSPGPNIFARTSWLKLSETGPYCYTKYLGDKLKVLPQMEKMAAKRCQQNHRVPRVALSWRWHYVNHIQFHASWK